MSDNNPLPPPRRAGSADPIQPQIPVDLDPKDVHTEPDSNPNPAQDPHTARAQTTDRSTHNGVPWQIPNPEQRSDNLAAKPVGGKWLARALFAAIVLAGIYAVFLCVSYVIVASKQATQAKAATTQVASNAKAPEASTVAVLSDEEKSAALKADIDKEVPYDAIQVGAGRSVFIDGSKCTGKGQFTHAAGGFMTFKKCASVAVVLELDDPEEQDELDENSL